MRGKVYKRCPKPRDGQQPCSARCGHTWTYDVEVARGADGRRRHLTKGGHRTKAEAEEALGKALDRERLGGVAADHKLTVGDYLEQWLAGKATLRPTTARSYGEHVRLYLLPVLGGVRLADLRPVHVERLYAAMRVLGAPDAKGSEVRALLEARTPLQRLTMRPLSPATVRACARHPAVGAEHRGEAAPAAVQPGAARRVGIGGPAARAGVVAGSGGRVPGRHQ